MAMILIIDDDEDIRVALEMALQAGGFDVLTAATAQEGIQAVLTAKPDLVVLDVMMDTATAGFQFSLTLHDQQTDSEFYEFRDIPIIMVTAIHSTTSLRFVPDEDYLPVQTFLEKPIDSKVLLETVRKYLG